jgi:hypothetical protein
MNRVIKALGWRLARGRDDSSARTPKGGATIAG